MSIYTLDTHTGWSVWPWLALLVLALIGWVIWGPRMHSKPREGERPDPDERRRPEPKPEPKPEPRPEPKPESADLGFEGAAHVHHRGPIYPDRQVHPSITRPPSSSSDSSSSSGSDS